VLTDTHCHLDFEKFDADRQEVLQRAWDAGLTRILIPGLDLKSSVRAVKLAESNPKLYTAIGVHPSDSLTWDGQTISALREISISQKVVAIGEIGLDYYWDAAPHEHQVKVLVEQLNLAEELELPVVIHLREKNDHLEGECSQDLLKILEKWISHLQAINQPLAERPGVLHSFSGSQDVAQKALELGFFIGVTGPVTYNGASKRQELISRLPLDKLLIETDAPFLTPLPNRGKRNEPAYVAFIADKIAEIHSTTREQVAVVTTENSVRLFGWGG
jgi:TatD DNase family protein